MNGQFNGQNVSDGTVSKSNWCHK